MIRTLLVSGTLVGPLTLRAQPQNSLLGQPLSIGHTYQIASPTLGTTRPIYVHLPPGYAQNPTARYPVLYVLDGEMHFQAIAATVDFLANGDAIPDLIVVGIPALGRRDVDYTPPGQSTAKHVPINNGTDTITFARLGAGGAPAFRRFLVDDVLPWMERHFRTAPFRLLAGHSLGGLFVLDALQREPTAFSAYIVTSPGLTYDAGRFRTALSTELSSRTFDQRWLHISTCEHEPEFTAQVRPITAALTGRTSRGAAGLRWSVGLIPDASHMTCAVPGTTRALRRAFAGWAFPDSLFDRSIADTTLAHAGAHYATLSRHLGYPIEVPVLLRDNIAQALRRAGRLDAARQLHEATVRAHPQVALAWAGLAKTLHAQGHTAEAIAALREAIERARATDDVRTAAYEQELARWEKAGPR